jgi:NAD(P)-dependent dehydrogenase (short-subunit alcohol dehydrogenase family)
MLGVSSAASEQISVPAIFKRTGKAVEVAALIAYLLGDESRFTTGAAYSIDGGWYC